MAKLTDGYGNEIPIEYLQEHLFDYVVFKDAAQMIDENWTRHHLHKEIKMGRVFKGELLIYHADSDVIPQNGYVKGTRFFITRTEIRRIKDDYEQRPKRTFERCLWCKRKLYQCRKSPCPNRLKFRPEFKDTVEKVAEYFTSFLRQNQEGRQSFTEFNKFGERKNLRNTKRRNSK